MKIFRYFQAALFLALLWTAPRDAFAGVPQPYWILYGQAVDEFGWPYTQDASVELRVHGKVFKNHPISGSVRPGLNFIFRLPMDSGTGDRYDALAGRPGDDYQVTLYAYGQVQSVLQHDVLPAVGRPGDVVRLNITAGTDVDQDGLPDEWEQWILSCSTDPLISTVFDIRPEDDFDGDGVSNLAEYKAGTDPTWSYDYFYIEQFQVTANGRLGITFLSVPGKTYRLEAGHLPVPESQPAWTHCPYAKSPTGTMQTDSFEGSGYYMTIYIDPSADMDFFRLSAE